MPLEQMVERLWATTPTPLPYLADVSLRAFLLERDQGNVIVYNTPGLNSAAADIGAHGGATRQLLSHGHEAMFGPADIGTPVYVHELDRAEVARSLPVAGTFSTRQKIDDDLEAIPIPGHTPGSTAYLWDNGSHRLLFTGDSIWLDRGNWAAVLLNPSARSTYVESLETVRRLDFDVLVPWGATEGENCLDAISRSQAQERIDAIIARLESGGNS